MKQCSVCKENKPLEDFSIRRRKLSTGEVKEYRRSQCLVCMRKQRKEWGEANPDKVKKYNTGSRKNFLTAKRRAALLNATPSWADMDAIKALYVKSREVSEIIGIPHEVDHVIPLQGKLVCGLHVEYNMEVITADANRKKSNSY